MQLTRHVTNYSSVVTYTFAYAVHLNSYEFLKIWGEVWGGALPRPRKKSSQQSILRQQMFLIICNKLLHIQLGHFL